MSLKRELGNAEGREGKKTKTNGEYFDKKLPRPAYTVCE